MASVASIVSKLARVRRQEREVLGVLVELNREGDVLGSERFAVMEGRAVDDRHRPGQPVFADRPLSRQLRHVFATRGDRDRRVEHELIQGVRLGRGGRCRDSGCPDSRPMPMRTVPPVAVPPPDGPAASVSLALGFCCTPVQAEMSRPNEASIAGVERRRRTVPVPPSISGAWVPGAGRPLRPTEDGTSHGIRSTFLVALRIPRNRAGTAGHTPSS